MAGDWLKIEASTPEKEEVLAITARMGWDDADLTVGKLFRLWRWFDQQTIDGNASRVTTALLDRIVGVSGFCEALREVGWLNITDAGITLPKFDRHNGATAKSRALTAKRVASHKKKTSGNASGNASTVSEALPREEKRRDSSIPDGIENADAQKDEATKAPRFNARAALLAEGVPEPLIAEWIALRNKKRATATQSVIDGIKEQAAIAGMTLAEAMRTQIQKGWQGFDAGWLKRNGARPGLSAMNRIGVDQGTPEGWGDGSDI